MDRGAGAPTGRYSQGLSPLPSPILSPICSPSFTAGASTNSGADAEVWVIWTSDNSGVGYG